MKFMKKQRLKSPFSQNLIRIRKEKGISQRELSRLTGISNRMLFYYENNAIRPPIDKIEIIAKALNVSLTDLLGVKAIPEAQIEFYDIDSRTIDKIKIILSLTKQQRHFIYSMAESLLKQSKVLKK